MAAKNYTEASVIHRQQWVGIDDAPVFTQLSLIHPFSNKVATGLNLYNFRSGALANTATSAQASFSYTLDFNPDTYFSFGISAGVGRNSIDVSKIDVSDPVFSGQLDKSFFLEGQVGVNFQFRKLNIGVSLPQLFKRSLTSSKDLQAVELDAFSAAVSSVGYRFGLGSDIAFEPLVMYRMDEASESKLGAFGTLYLKDLFWVGGSYKQDYGPSAYLGLQINEKIQLGYCYEFGSTTTAAINNKTHEFRIAVKFGKRRVNRQQSATKAEEEDVTEDALVEVPEEEKTEAPLDKQAPDVVINETPVQESKPTETVSQPPIVKEEQPKQEEKISPSTVETKTPTVIEKEIPAPAVMKTDPRPVSQSTKENAEESKPVDRIVVENKKPLVERVVKATKSARRDELSRGVYVIVGVFGVSTNAKKYIEQLRADGYEGNMGYNSGTKLNYVYVHGGESLEEARLRRDELRNIEKFQFRDAWILTIE